MTLVHVQRRCRRGAAGSARHVHDRDLLRVAEERDAQVRPVDEHLARADVRVGGGAAAVLRRVVRVEPLLLAAEVRRKATARGVEVEVHLAGARIAEAVHDERRRERERPRPIALSVRSGPTRIVNSPSST